MVNEKLVYVRRRSWGNVISVHTPDTPTPLGPTPVYLRPLRTSLRPSGEWTSVRTCSVRLRSCTPVSGLAPTPSLRVPRYRTFETTLVLDSAFEPSCHRPGVPAFGHSRVLLVPILPECHFLPFLNIFQAVVICLCMFRSV